MKGFNIHEVLNFSVAKFANVFPEFSNVTTILQECGLSYLNIGQALNTLSGGELQRLKLAKNLLHNNSTTIVLDEPTSGLHESNIQQIITLLKKLIVKRQVTIIVVEHNLRFIGQADWVIDMGPSAGDNGGKVLFEGSPIELMNHYQTNTSIAMQEYFLNNGYTD